MLLAFPTPLWHVQYQEAAFPVLCGHPMLHVGAPQARRNGRALP